MEINPIDSGKLGIKHGEMLRVSSRRGTIDIKARVTDRIRNGLVFIPMHYHEAAANLLTIDALDPIVKIPELKVCAVRVERLSREPIDCMPSVSNK